MLDVAVVGGGPVGSRVAYQLAKLGHQVAVFEKRPAIGEKPCCTGIISRECVQRYAIPPNVIYRNCNSARIFSPSGEPLHVFREEVQASIVNRRAFDQEMANRAQSAGATYFLNCPVETLSVFADRARVESGSLDSPLVVEAKAVVLASGFNSPLVKRCGFGQSTYRVSGAQAEVEMHQVEEVEVYFDQDLAPGFFGWLVPRSNGRGLVGLLTRQSPGKHLREWIARLEGQQKIQAGQYSIKHGGIPLKPLHRTYRARVLVTGDAAGQVKPTTGGGLYFGLLCADIAANTLHNALLEGDLSARNLSIYERDWQQLLESELNREYLARRLYERLSNRQVEGLFARLRSSGIVESLLQDESVSFDWHGGLMTRVLKYSLKRVIGRG